MGNILRLVVFNKISKAQKRKTFLLKRKSYVLKETYETAFGEIEIYTVNYYKTKEKAKKLFVKNFGNNFHTAEETPNKDYLIKLLAKKAINMLKSKEINSVFINCDMEFSLIEEICRYAKELYLNQELYFCFGQKLFENCGVLPREFKSGICCDMVLDGKENCQAVLPKELLEVCPKEFSPTLFCSLIYTENGYFIG